MNKVLVNFIQDRSGSMSSVWDETVNGFKSFVKELRDGAAKDGVEYLFSLTVFDTQVDTPVIAKPIADVDLDVLSEHGPRGSTALYDAVGTTIKNTDDNRHGADKIICVVVTDGQENSSREWTKDSLHSFIEAKLKAGDWTFTYLGTQPETWDDAQALGVHVGSVAAYTPKMANAAYTATSHAIRSLSASASMGSRKLMHDFMPQQMARAAGMTVKDSMPPKTRTGTVARTLTASTKSSTRRWK